MALTPQVRIQNKVTRFHKRVFARVRKHLTDEGLKVGGIDSHDEVRVAYARVTVPYTDDEAQEVTELQAEWDAFMVEDSEQRHLAEAIRVSKKLSVTDQARLIYSMTRDGTHHG